MHNISRQRELVVHLIESKNETVLHHNFHASEKCFQVGESLASRKTIYHHTGHPNPRVFVMFVAIVCYV